MPAGAVTVLGLPQPRSHFPLPGGLALSLPGGLALPPTVLPQPAPRAASFQPVPTASCLPRAMQPQHRSDFLDPVPRRACSLPSPVSWDTNCQPHKPGSSRNFGVTPVETQRGLVHAQARTPAPTSP